MEEDLKSILKLVNMSEVFRRFGHLCSISHDTFRQKISTNSKFSENQIKEIKLMLLNVSKDLVKHNFSQK